MQNNFNFCKFVYTKRDIGPYHTNNFKSIKMKAEHQTDELKVRVYKLTLSFVRKYQPQLYKQYRGEQEDLALDIYSNFLTKKSREFGKEASLLDKYDEKITSLEYLLKVSTKNMLIDRSRSDSTKVVSIDHFVEEYGDFFAQSFGLTTEDEETVDSMEFTEEFILNLAVKYDGLAESAKKTIEKQYFEVKSILEPRFQQLFDSIIKPKQVVKEIVEEVKMQIITPVGEAICSVQQITAKTVCLLYEGTIKEFNRLTGEARGKDYKDLVLSDGSLQELMSRGIFHSGKDRDTFLMEYAY